MTIRAFEHGCAVGSAGAAAGDELPVPGQRTLKTLRIVRLLPVLSGSKRQE